MPIKIESDLIYKVEEVAELLDRTKIVIRGYCKDGKIPGSAKRGGEWFIPGWGLKKYLEGEPKKKEK